MAQFQFFEKPGCVGNARQRQLLIRAGHQLEVIDLLSFPWCRASLRAFLAELPVAQWFNPAAPAVKRGEVDPQRLDAEQALTLLLASPLLIRRPLLVVEGQRLVGFDLQRLSPWLSGVAGDYQSCPTPASPCDSEPTA